ncbi:MAG: ubiquinone/menaquinone biosynthesis methyltransferase [Candidatus Krumholzibacteriia bacterium]
MSRVGRKLPRDTRSEARNADGEAHESDPGDGSPGAEVDSRLQGAPAPRVRDLFARIASTYDLLNHLLSAGRDRAWRRRLVEALDPGARRILDLCAGTGDLALEIAARGPGALVCAGDFCYEMLMCGGPKGLQRAAAPAACDALRLPFADATFDAITVAFGVRNFERLDFGLAEMHRVTRPGGQVAVLEFFRSESSWRELPFRIYFTQVLPRVGRLVSRDPDAYSYLPQSVSRFVTRREFEALLADTGFTEIRRREMSLGIATLSTARVGERRGRARACGGRSGRRCRRRGRVDSARKGL